MCCQAALSTRAHVFVYSDNIRRTVYILIQRRVIFNAREKPDDFYSSHSRARVVARPANLEIVFIYVKAIITIEVYVYIFVITLNDDYSTVINQPDYKLYGDIVCFNYEHNHIRVGGITIIKSLSYIIR